MGGGKIQTSQHQQPFPQPQQNRRSCSFLNNKAAEVAGIALFQQLQTLCNPMQINRPLNQNYKGRSAFLKLAQKVVPDRVLGTSGLTSVCSL
jgi:hypothetical protein